MHWLNWEASGLNPALDLKEGSLQTLIKQTGAKLENLFTNSGELFREARTRFIHFFYASTKY